MTYEEFAKLPASEKVTLVTLEANQLIKKAIFDFSGSGIWYRDVDHLVSSVKVNGLNAQEVFSKDELSLKWSEGKQAFFFDSFNKRLYLQMLFSIPNQSEIICTYKFFFATTPQRLPCDLALGHDVEWDARLQPIGTIGQQLDDENSGIVIESKSTVSLINTDGFFDDVFDTLIWENQNVKIYIWSPRIPLSLATLRFDGKIDSKTFGSDKVSFKINDSIYKLRKNVALGLFSELDGRVQDSNIGKAKKRIYGRADKVICSGLSHVLNGVSGKGFITYVAESNNITGSGTTFLSDLSPGDEISFKFDKFEDKFSVESILSDTSITISKKFEYSFTNIAYIHDPFTPLRTMNRKWNLSGHKIADPKFKIIEVIANNRFVVDDTSDITENDRLLIGDDFVSVRRVSGNVVVTESAVNPLPEINDYIFKLPVQNVYFNQKQLAYGRDWTFENGSNCNIIISEFAEREIKEPKELGRTVTFTAGSREVTTTSVVDFRSILEPRDWIRSANVGHPVWYEILDVDEQKITLRTEFAGIGETNSAFIKQVEYIEDDSLITASCLGKMDENGKWIKTSSEVVRDLLLHDANFDSINEESFEIAKEDCDYLVSMVLPLGNSGSAQPIRDVITSINNSVFGSLYGDKASKLSFSILNSEKPDDIIQVQDDDIQSFSVVTNQKIVNSVKVNFSPFTDLVNGGEAFKNVVFINQFVNDHVGIENDLEITSYLYNQADAQAIAERLAFFRSLSTSTVTLKGGLFLSLLNVNDKVSLFMKRLYRRYGSLERAKIGIVSSVKTDGSNVTAEVNDLGNIFNRVPSVANNESNDIETAEEFDKLRHGYIVDNNYLTPQVSSEEMLGSNLIG